MGDMLECYTGLVSDKLTTLCSWRFGVVIDGITWHSVGHRSSLIFILLVFAEYMS